MAANLFTTAKVLEAKGTKAKKPVKVTTLVEGLELYAALDHSIKWLKTVLETTKTTVLETAIQKFVTDGARLQSKPTNFDGEEGKATANIQLKKRASTSGLNDIELELVNEYKVPVEQVSDRPETLIVNPEHLEWLLKNSDKISAAITKIPGAPTELFQMQQATTKFVTTDDSIDFVFRTFNKKPEVIAKLLPVIATLAIKPKFDTADESVNDTALDVIKEFLTDDDAE